MANHPTKLSDSIPCPRTPYGSGDGMQTAQTPPVIEGAPKTKALTRILMVEDEPDIQAVAQIGLESVGGLQVEMCSSGQEALDRVLACAPDLILMDVMMPGLD